MQGLHDAALPSTVGKSSFVDLTDDVSDTDLEVSLQSRHCSFTSVDYATVSVVFCF